MSKTTAFDAAKHRNNPKVIVKYLNDALATDDARFYYPSHRQRRARPRNAGHCREGECRSRRSLQIAPRRHGSSVRDSIEGPDRARRTVGRQTVRRLVELGLKARRRADLDDCGRLSHRLARVADQN